MTLASHDFIMLDYFNMMVKIAQDSECYNVRLTLTQDQIPSLQAQ